MVKSGERKTMQVCYALASNVVISSGNEYGMVVAIDNMMSANGSSWYWWWWRQLWPQLKKEKANELAPWTIKDSTLSKALSAIWLEMAPKKFSTLKANLHDAAITNKSNSLREKWSTPASWLHHYFGTLSKHPYHSNSRTITCKFEYIISGYQEWYLQIQTFDVGRVPGFRM